jgi:hypothetical protein
VFWVHFSSSFSFFSSSSSFFNCTTVQCGSLPPYWTSPSQLCFLTSLSNL